MTTTSTAQLYYEDITVGMAIPSLEKQPTYVQLFLYSAVTRIVHRIHWDQAYARQEGHPDVLVHGPLQGDFLAQMLTNWIGGSGFLKKIFYSNRGSATPGDRLTCKGKVTGKHEQDDHHLVECEIWEENQHGDVLIHGSAVVALPARGLQA